jgi:3-dehydroquinate dehydratase/shikimate dehydrogenase
MPKYVWSVLLNLQKALSFYDVVFDAVYAPKVTRLLREAEECGVKVIRQAMGQFEHFTGGIEGVMFF